MARPLSSRKSKRISIERKVASSLALKLKKLPPTWNRCSIYKVPERLRKVNEEAYTPRLVSIGPLHHGRPRLQAMERYKMRYLRYLLERTELELDILIGCVMELEIEVREHYQDTIDISSEKFVEMLLLDGVFVIVLFFMNRFPEMRDVGDVIFTNQWMTRELLHDMMLLENQLPICLPEKLLDVCYSHLLSPNPDSPACLYESTFFWLAYMFFKNAEIDAALLMGRNLDTLYEIRHLVEYLQILYRPVDDIYVGQKCRGEFEYTRSATELQEAGVKFVKESEMLSIFDIRFTSGELRIPPLQVNAWTETLFRNLVAFEQCDHQYKYISSYVIFMDSLINTPRDVDLLVKCGIIVNSLGDSKQVSDLFNNLYKETVADDNIFYFADICDNLNDYSKNFWSVWKAAWYRWKVILKRDYFSNPWKVMSVLAAVVLLLLTAVQTLCSVLALKH